MRPADPPRDAGAIDDRRLDRPGRPLEAESAHLDLESDPVAAVELGDAGRIGERACALLDRGLRDRPGALRLVGVGVSGLSDFKQLSLVE